MLTAQREPTFQAKDRKSRHLEEDLKWYSHRKNEIMESDASSVKGQKARGKLCNR